MQTETLTEASAATPLTPEMLRRIDAYWRATNYLSVGQIYLYDNPLLRRPLKKEHIKPRLLGHWGTTPGLNFLYVHLNRLIKQRDLSMIYISGPGHGGPAVVANCNVFVIECFLERGNIVERNGEETGSVWTEIFPRIRIG